MVGLSVFFDKSMFLAEMGKNRWLIVVGAGIRISALILRWFAFTQWNWNNWQVTSTHLNLEKKFCKFFHLHSLVATPSFLVNLNESQHIGDWFHVISLFIDFIEWFWWNEFVLFSLFCFFLVCFTVCRQAGNKRNRLRAMGCRFNGFAIKNIVWLSIKAVRPSMTQTSSYQLACMPISHFALYIAFWFYK